MLSDYVFGRFLAPLICPHDESIYSVESQSDEVTAPFKPRLFVSGKDPSAIVIMDLLQ